MIGCCSGIKWFLFWSLIFCFAIIVQPFKGQLKKEENIIKAWFCIYSAFLPGIYQEMQHLHIKKLGKQTRSHGRYFMWYITDNPHIYLPPDPPLHFASSFLVLYHGKGMLPLQESWICQHAFPRYGSLYGLITADGFPVVLVQNTTF